MKNIFIIFSFEIILQTKQIYYISFEVTLVDDCLTKIYKNNNTSEILYQKSSKIACSPTIIPNNPVLFQYKFVFGDEFYFEISDPGGKASCIRVNTRINEYLIEPKLNKFWKCVNCRTDDNNYIYNSVNQVFDFYILNKSVTISSYFYI